MRDPDWPLENMSHDEWEQALSDIRQLVGGETGSQFLR